MRLRYGRCMLRLLDGSARLGGCSLGKRCGAFNVRFVALTGRLCCVAVTGPCCACGCFARLECVMLVGVSLENDHQIF